MPGMDEYSFPFRHQRTIPSLEKIAIQSSFEIWMNFTAAAVSDTLYVLESALTTSRDGVADLIPDLRVEWG